MDLGMAKLRPYALVRSVYALVRVYGRKRLAQQLILAVAQAGTQVFAVSSVFPFLSLATDPQQFRQSLWCSALALDGFSDRDLLVGSGIVTVSAIMIANVVALIAELLRARFVHSIGSSMRRDLLSDTLRQPYSFFLESDPSEAFQTIQVDVQQFCTNVLMPMLTAFAAILSIVVLLTVMTLADPVLALSAVCCVGLFYIAIFCILRPWSRRIGASVREDNREMAALIQQLLANVKSVYAYDAGRVFLTQYEDVSSQFARRVPWIDIYAKLPRYLVEPIGIGGIMMWMLWLALASDGVTAALPSLGVITLCAYRLLPQAQDLYARASGLVSYGHLVRNLHDWKSRSLASDDLEGQGAPSARCAGLRSKLAFRGVSFSYNCAPHPILQNVNLAIAAKSAVALVGPSGSGKTTFLDLAMGLLQPSEGCIEIDGVRLSGRRIASWRQAVGYVPQDVQVFRGSVAFNIAMGIIDDGVGHKRVREAARQAQLLEFIESSLPGEFDAMLGEGGIQLSGGQRQRLGLARALFRDPAVLILDEFTSALDKHTERQVVQVLSGLKGNLTILMITHRDAPLSICDQEIVFPLPI